MQIRLCYVLSCCLAALLTWEPQACAVEFDKAPIRQNVDTAVPIAELFSGIDDKLVDVQFIPLNASQANLLMTNNTDRMLHIQLPSSFAAVPVLAQFGNNMGGQNFGAGDGFAGGRQGGGGTQGVGGGINAGQGQGIGLGQGMQGMQFGGLMRIPPGKTRKLKATTVCLEHGKPEPNPRLPYRIIPMEQFNNDSRVADLCAQLARGEINQNTAQAAAWHLANGLDWSRLARINRFESRYLGKVPYFSTADLEQAQSLVSTLSERHEPKQESASDSSDTKNSRFFTPSRASSKRR